MRKVMRDRRWTLLTALTLLAAGSVLTACTVSISGGIVGGLMTALFTLFLIFGVGSSQSGCDDGVGPCLSIAADANVGPCLSQQLPDGSADAGVDVSDIDAHVGPCLSQQLPDGSADAGVDVSDIDAHVGPCLSQPQPDLGQDAHVGPCLSQAPADAGQDTNVGPCLSQPPASEPGNDPVPQAQAAPRVDVDRAAVLARLKHRLPPDVLARLTDDEREES